MRVSVPSHNCSTEARRPMLVTVPLLPADIEHIAHAERALEQQDEAADEILQHVLHAEAQADGQRAAGEGEHGQRNLDRHQAEQEQAHHQQGPQPAADQVGLVGLDLQPLDDDGLDEAP